MTRTIKPEEFMSLENDAVMILDIRRDEDYEASNEIVPNAIWKDPTVTTEWIASIPKDKDVIIYCVRGGGVSNSVLDQLLENDINARFIEGGIVGLKDAGGVVTQKT